MNNQSSLSIELTKKLESKIKKENGIYFTPINTITKCLEIINSIKKKEEIVNILEPSCGSCNFIDKINDIYNSKKIIGVENNELIYSSIKNRYKEEKKNNIELVNKDFLQYDVEEKKFDLIIGNPPYFVIPKKQCDKKYYEFFDGRPNIFILFIIKCIFLLNNNGILCFILPKSFLNCIYYNKLRNYIENNYCIHTIIKCDDNYIETKQETIIFIISKRERVNNTKYVLKKNNLSIYGIEKDILELKELYKNSKSLKELNFFAKVGNIVWNENKSILTNDENKTRLIYSSDIKNKQLILQKYKNKEKKNFINKKGINKMCLLLNRGYGVGNYNFEFCIMNENEEIDYLVENHLICILYNDDKIKKKDLLTKYKILSESLKNEKTKKFIKLYFGNNAINITELNEVLPFYEE